MDTRSDNLESYRLLAATLLLLAVCWLPPVPIDETRYLAVAWNMHWRGDWLVPWLDGSAYPDKPPLLFWLINAAWWLTGIHAWTARVLEVGLALLTLPLLHRLARELGADAPAATHAGWLWLGSLAFAGYAGAVMFDMLLCVCALAAWLGGVWLSSGRWLAGTTMLILGLGLGVLAKGPVSLLVGGLPALFGPWWQASARQAAGRYYLGVAVALTGAAALALAWAIPAALHGGPDYANAIFLGQTAGRMERSFAHDRGLAWYLPLVPVLLLPWLVGIGRARQAVGGNPPATVAADRFALAATVPAFLAFCLISGKQAHYLLPLLPALAPAVGIRLAAGRWQIAGRRIGLLLLAVSAATWLGLAKFAGGPAALLIPWLVAALVVGLTLAFWKPGGQVAPWTAALACISVVAIAKGVFLTGAAERFGIGTAAREIAAAERAGVPLLMTNKQNGLFTFAGRLRTAIPTAPGPDYVAAWIAAHPNGWIISSDGGFDYPSPPLYEQPFLNRRLAIWRAADIDGEAVAHGAGHPGATR